MTSKTYEEATIPKDISLEEAKTTLVAVVNVLEAHGVIPFIFPLPPEGAR